MRAELAAVIARPIRYVARSDRSRGGLLIANSRLSDYFEGPNREQDAALACDRLRVTYPDAGVFSAHSVADAEQRLATVGVHHG